MPPQVSKYAIAVLIPIIILAVIIVMLTAVIIGAIAAIGFSELGGF